MALISIADLSLQYRGRSLFDGASLSVDPGDRLGLVGANGTGKSTLFRVVTEELVPDSGQINFAKGLRIGYLPQELQHLRPGKLLETTVASAPGLRDLESQRAALLLALERSTHGSDQMRLAEALSELDATLLHLDQHFAPHNAARILTGLGFVPSDFERRIEELSGGWRMRAALAGLLFQRPDVLLLDEPTNHLDLPSVAWLDRFLARFYGALVLICHDREFLNRHVTRIAALEVDGLHTYRGNYDRYLDQREIDLDMLARRIKKDDQRRKELEGFVERFRAKNTKARQAQSKQKQIEKLLDQQEEIPRPRQSMSIRFAPVARASDIVLSLENLGFSYGEKAVFRGANLFARRQERVAIAGMNGSGKTTLLKVIANELAAGAGAVKLGQNVQVAHYAQHHAEVLDPQKTVLEEVWAAAPELTHTQARATCGAFLFSGDDVDKSIAFLSGGEKARVALAKLLVKPGNLLLLDEPTNHLDTESAELLTASLETYDGTLLFVSHNLDFARRLSTKVWNLADGRVEEYPGSFGEYLEHLNTVTGEEDDSIAPRDGPSGARADRPADKEERMNTREELRRAEAALKKAKSRLERVVAEAELQIAQLETAKSELEVVLSEPENLRDPQRARALSARYAELQQSLEAQLSTWEIASAELAAL